jgi:ankyrin repeat protein
LVTALGATANKSIEGVKKALSEDVDVNADDGAGGTALMYAARKGNTDIAKLLISHGADFNAKNRRGYTALRFAAREGHTEIVLLLKQAGAKE